MDADLPVENGKAKKLRVGILGATDTVGQRFIRMLERHPQFEVTALAACDGSQGEIYKNACVWRLSGEMPEEVKSLFVEPPRPPLDCDFVFSSLPAVVAQEAEEMFARAGYPVISNSSAHRLEPDVPLLIPEVNHQHLQLLESQICQRRYRNDAFIVANPSCSVIVRALALAPLHERFGVASVVVTTMQALSGVGYPGMSSLDAIDNLVPFIDGEEQKIERETVKILGSVENHSVHSAQILLSAQCNRVNITDGHLLAVRVSLLRQAGVAEVGELLATFSSLPQELRLYSAPKRPIIVRNEIDRPQPRLDRDASGGMAISVGRIARDRVLDIRFLVLGHNTIRGRAGAAILSAEMLIANGYL